MLNRAEIKTFLPHREPMLILDSVFLDKNGDANGEYTVSGEEFFLSGHFPGFPVVPGVILCEIIAQSAGILVMDELKKGELPLFIGIENVRFRQMVKPGDTVKTKCKLLRSSGKLVKIKGVAKVNEQVCVDGIFLLMLRAKDD
ncbi:MAG: 3-hydroxyacyl-ACP dehydratase FabZ [Christensenellales bacterium]|jgi:3-hydroxyacyl-[acyl-carrier-protein] dehydratase